VRFCWHAISIHEQRMSFPLDSIRKNNDYPDGVRREIAYPGVHSDVGGGYAPGAQGKGRGSDDQDDSHKLSQITLHDMYIAALKYGVPLMKGDQIAESTALTQDFALDPGTITAFNAWLKTTDSAISRVEDAMKFGMGQLLTWRTLRARFDGEHASHYITEQDFFKAAREDALTPRKVTEALKEAKKTDPKLLELISWPTTSRSKPRRTPSAPAKRPCAAKSPKRAPPLARAKAPTKSPPTTRRICARGPKKCACCSVICIQRDAPPSTCAKSCPPTVHAMPIRPPSPFPPCSRFSVNTKAAIRRT
jgi:hypothetical protein